MSNFVEFCCEYVTLVRNIFRGSRGQRTGIYGSLKGGFVQASLIAFTMVLNQLAGLQFVLQLGHLSVILSGRGRHTVSLFLTPNPSAVDTPLLQ